MRLMILIYFTLITNLFASNIKDENRGILYIESAETAEQKEAISYTEKRVTFYKKHGLDKLINQINNDSNSKKNTNDTSLLNEQGIIVADTVKGRIGFDIKSAYNDYGVSLGDFLLAQIKNGKERGGIKYQNIKDVENNYNCFAYFEKIKEHILITNNQCQDAPKASKKSENGPIYQEKITDKKAAIVHTIFQKAADFYQKNGQEKLFNKIIIENEFSAGDLVTAAVDNNGIIIAHPIRSILGFDTKKAIDSNGISIGDFFLALLKDGKKSGWIIYKEEGDTPSSIKSCYSYFQKFDTFILAAYNFCHS